MILNVVYRHKKCANLGKKIKFASILRHLWAKFRISSKYRNVYFKTWEWLLWLNLIISIRSEFKSIGLNIRTTSASPLKLSSPADTMACEHNHFTPQQRFKCTSDHCRKSLKVQKRSERSVKLPESSDGTRNAIIVGGGFSHTDPLLDKQNPSSICWLSFINSHLFQRDR